MNRPLRNAHQPGTSPDAGAAGAGIISIEGGRRRALPRLRRRGALALAIALALPLALWLARVPILTGVGGALTVNSPLAAADLIFQYGGDYITRAPVTADLYARGLAPRVVLMRVKDDPFMEGTYANETDRAVQLLQELGVPRTAIDVFASGDGVSSTTEESGDLSRVLIQDRTERVIVVTSWYHARRARWALRRALDGAVVSIAMANAPTPGYHAGSWWRVKAGRVSVMTEYLKFLHNFFFR